MKDIDKAHEAAILREEFNEEPRITSLVKLLCAYDACPDQMGRK